MREIPLTQGQVALIDDEDYERVAQYKWCASYSNGGSIGYAVRDSVSGTVLMHRFILATTEGVKVDHRDLNGFNNQKANIRLCTTAQNAMNKRKSRFAFISRFKGVGWDSARGKWNASIYKDAHRFNLGRFASEVDAAAAYNKAATEMFGEFALLNEIAS